MPPEETPGPVAARDEAVHHAHHHSAPPSSVITGHRDHKRKRRKHDANGDALPPHQELTAARSTTVDADRGATEPATPTSGAHRSQRRAPAAERTTDAGGSSIRDDNASPSSVAPPPASSKSIRVKHSSSSFVISGGGGKQHPAAGSGSSLGGGSHSYYASSHAAAAPSSSSRFTIRAPAAPPPPPLHLPAKATRPSLASAAPSAAVPLEPDDKDERFRQGVGVFAEWDFAAQQAAVSRFVREEQQPPPEGGEFSFWLTPAEAEADLKYVDEMLELEAQKKAARNAVQKHPAASGSGKPRRH